MANIAFLNNEFVEQDKASLSIFDRSILFSDAVYEVVCFIDGKFLDFEAHILRLERSLSRLSINYPFKSSDILNNARELAKRNGYKNGIIYIQVTRGAASRDFVIGEHLKPILFMFAAERSIESLLEAKTLTLQTHKDKRWALCDIKTTQLLYASLAKTAANKAGYDDALLVKDGFITEASSANFHIIDVNGALVTRPTDGAILPGITRATLIELARELNIEVIERPIAVDELKFAKEAFISSATTFVHPVIEVDDVAIGTGEVSKMLRKIYLEKVTRI